MFCGDKTEETKTNKAGAGDILYHYTTVVVKYGLHAHPSFAYSCVEKKSRAKGKESLQLLKSQHSNLYSTPRLVSILTAPPTPLLATMCAAEEGRSVRLDYDQLHDSLLAIIIVYM